MAKQRRTTNTVPQTLSNSLVLNRFILNLFGTKSLRELSENLKDPAYEGYTEDGVSIFVEQLKNLYQEGDVVIGISGSGNSNNVLKAIEYANAHGGITVGLTGYSGGRLKEMAQCGVHIPINDMQIAEDLHMVLDHCMMKILCNHNSCC